MTLWMSSGETSSVLHQVSILQEIEKKTNSSKFNNLQSLMLSIEQILIGKDEILNNIVNKISTSL